MLQSRVWPLVLQSLDQLDEHDLISSTDSDDKALLVETRCPRRLQSVQRLVQSCLRSGLSCPHCDHTTMPGFTHSGIPYSNMNNGK